MECIFCMKTAIFQPRPSWIYLQFFGIYLHRASKITGLSEWGLVQSSPDEFTFDQCLYFLDCLFAQEVLRHIGFNAASFDIKNDNRTFNRNYDNMLQDKLHGTSEARVSSYLYSTWKLWHSNCSASCKITRAKYVLQNDCLPMNLILLEENNLITCNCCTTNCTVQRLLHSLSSNTTSLQNDCPEMFLLQNAVLLWPTSHFLVEIPSNIETKKHDVGWNTPKNQPFISILNHHMIVRQASICNISEASPGHVVLTFGVVCFHACPGVLMIICIYMHVLWLWCSCLCSVVAILLT